MAMTSPPLLKLSLPLLLLISTLSSTTPKPQPKSTTTLQILNTLTHTTSINTIFSDDTSRLIYLSSLAKTPAKKPRSFVPIAPGRQLLQIPTYVVRATLGSPGQTLLAALDISNNAAWFPCTGCTGCPTSTTTFTTSLSSSFLPVPCGSPQCSQVPNPSCPTEATAPCSFSFTYGSSSVQAGLCQDSLTLGSDVVPAYTFGCLQQVTGASVPPQGLLGLGRGPLSLLCQTNNLYSSTFSYCLPSYKSSNFSGTLRLGTVGQPKRIKTTPLLTNPRRPSFYYVNMTGIRVGKKVVPIPPESLAFDPTTGAGTIIDSGTMYTRLVGPAYAAVRDAFRAQVVGATGPVTTLGGFDTCFNGPITAPVVTLMFDGMLSVKLPADNVLIHSSSGSLSCLAMAGAPENVNSGLNVIANMQQQNFRVLFDVPNGRVGFARETCKA